MKNNKQSAVAVASIAGIAVIACFFLMTFISSCGNDGSKKVRGESQDVLSTTNVAEGISMTFIELGSVRCIPCKMMQPVMKKIEETYPHRVKVVFYDVWTEKDKDRAVEYRINAIPTQVFLDRAGQEYFRHTGYFPFEEVEKILKMKL